MKTTEAQKPTIWRWGKWASHPLRKDFFYRKDKTRHKKITVKGTSNQVLGVWETKLWGVNPFYQIEGIMKLLLWNPNEKMPKFLFQYHLEKNTNPLGKNCVQICRALTSNTTLTIVSIREDINRKKTFSFGHCPNPLNPPPPDPNSGNLVLFFGRKKRRLRAWPNFFWW